MSLTLKQLLTSVSKLTSPTLKELMAKKTATTGEKSTTGKKTGGKKSTTNASSKISTKSSSSKKGTGTGKSKSKSKTGEQKRKSGGSGGGGGPKSYKKLHHSIKMPSSVAPTSSPKSKLEGSATSEKSKSGKKAAKKSMSTVEQGAIKGATTTTTTADKSALMMVKSSKVDLLETTAPASSSKPTEVQSTAVVQPVPSSKLCSDIEPGGKKSSAVKLVSSKPSSNLGQAAVPSTLNPPKPKTKTAPKPAGAGVKSMVVKSNCGVKTSASTAAAPPPSIALANDDGSIFNSSVQNGKGVSK